MSADGDLCPKCDEEFVNCTCAKNSGDSRGAGGSSHTTYNEDGSVELYDGWYDPGK